jgi:hypothetical protein
MKTIRSYLAELTQAYSGVDAITKNILDVCEEQAKYGHKYHRHSVHKSRTEEVVSYLVTVGKLDVEVLHNNDNSDCDLIEVSWDGGSDV